MATTDLRLEEPGSLPRPGLLGRLLRLAFGLLCLAQVQALLQIADAILSGTGAMPALLWNGLLIALLLVSYVVNIGFSRHWKKWPAIASAAMLALVAAYGYVTSGTAETALLAQVAWAWQLYVFSHLGLAFLLAAALGTPGCEMRAFHDLYARLTGVPTREHHCPVGPLQPLDRWEAQRRQR